MYIDSDEELQKLCAGLRKAKVIYFDTEFMRERSFYPKLCLIQVGYGKHQAAIDPLAKLDLKPLLKILTSATKLLVFHSGRQDLEIIYNLTGKLPKNIFDTQLAAMVCGFGEQVSYMQLVEQICGEKIDKSQRFTDWSKRPLLKKQIDYALADVVYLPKIHDSLAGALKTQKRGKWLNAEEEALLDIKTYKENPKDAWTKIKHKGKKHADLGVLQALAEWREKEAIRKDKPRGFIIKNEILVELAIQRPKTEKAIQNFRGLGNVSRETSAKILAVIQQGCDLPDSKKPKLKPRPTRKADSGVIDMLKLLLKKTCEKEKIAPRLIADSSDLEKFALGEEAIFSKGWRYETFGKKAEQLLRGEIFFKISNGQLKITRKKQAAK